jgi:hypothetical protein
MRIPMLRISWPLAIILAFSIFLIGRNRALLAPILIVFVVWFLWEQSKRRRR